MTRTAWIVAAVLLVGAAGFWLIALKFRVDPDFIFLSDSSGQHWIKPDLPPHLQTRTRDPYVAAYRTAIAVDAQPETALLTWRAFTSAQIQLDGRIVHSERYDDKQWKHSRRVDLAPALTPGKHEIVIIVTNRRGPPMLSASSPSLGVATDESWEVTTNGTTWSPAIFASSISRADIAGRFPRVSHAFARMLPVYVPLFLAVFIVTIQASRNGLPRWAYRIKLSAARVHWIVIAAWAVLALNNLRKLPAYIGMDIDAHLDYVRYIVENKTLPLATEGVEMMQSPLFYVVSAGLYALLDLIADTDAIHRMLRILPLLCGLAQVELSYRAVRRIFPERQDLQILGTLLGGLLPMNLYLSQSIANEPMAGLFGGMAYLATLSLLTANDAPDTKQYVGLGLVFGLALLTKVSAVLLAPPLAVAVVYATYRHGLTRERFVWRLAALGAATALVSGPYYLSNWIQLGKPFLGTWDTASGASWWQDPGYRMAGQYFRFGDALTAPIFSATRSFWDGMYSTFWADGMLSGIIQFDFAPPWNYTPMLAGLWLALLPSLAILIGLIAPMLRRHDPVNGEARSPAAVVFYSGACVAFYIAAIAYMHLTIPYYCLTKASYLAALIPCFAVLAAFGFRVITCNPLITACVWGWMACWTLSAYASFFIV